MVLIGKIDSIAPIDSTYYSSLLVRPPKDILFYDSLKLNKNKNIKYETIFSKQKFLLKKYFKKILYKGLSFLKEYPFLKIKYSLYAENPKIDFIHSARTLILNTKKPIILDFEHYGVLGFLYSHAYSPLGIHIIKKYFSKKEVKYILPWTKAAYKTIPDQIKKDKKISKKIKIVYPAIESPKIKTKKNKDNITFTFIARYFVEKGGYTVLKVFTKILKDAEINKKYNTNCVIVSPSIPPKTLKICKKYNIKVYPYLEKKKIYELLSKSYLYIYPGYSDSFGFTFLESMAVGTPIITSEGFARDEIILHGKTGYIIKRSNKEVENYVKYIKYLLENEDIYRKLSKNSKQLIKKGKFSISYRNKILKKIYENSVSF